MTGEAHSLFWQFIPSLVLVAKAGEAFNRAPWFVSTWPQTAAIENAETITEIHSPNPYFNEIDDEYSANLVLKEFRETIEFRKEPSLVGMLIWFEQSKTRGQTRGAASSTPPCPLSNDTYLIRAKNHRILLRNIWSRRRGFLSSSGQVYDPRQRRRRR